MATVEDLAGFIINMEGTATPGSRGNRNNNPGNIKDNDGHTIFPSYPHDDKNFVIFPSWQDGLNALYHQIKLDASRGLSLESFIYKYAPPNENSTENYLSYVSQNLGMNRNDSLSKLDSGGVNNDVNPTQYQVDNQGNVVTASDVSLFDTSNVSTSDVVIGMLVAAVGVGIFLRG